MVEGDEIGVLEGRVGAGARCASRVDGIVDLGGEVSDDGGDGMNWVWFGAVRSPSWWWGKRRGRVSRSGNDLPWPVS